MSFSPWVDEPSMMSEVRGFSVQSDDEASMDYSVISKRRDVNKKHES